MKKIICFEGTSGCGKTTLCEMVASYLDNKGLNVKKAKFPTPYLKEYIQVARYSEKRDPLLEAYLFASDFRHYYTTKILPAKEDTIFICDRSFVTSCADSNFGENSITKILNINKYNPAPDHLFILECSPENAMMRINQRYKETGKMISKLENETYISALRNKFLSLLTYFPDALIINTDAEIDIVFKKVRKVLDINLTK